MGKTIREEIEEISTHHSDDGTSGYLLSDKQVDDLVALIEREKRELLDTLKYDTASRLMGMDWYRHTIDGNVAMAHVREAIQAELDKLGGRDE